MSGFPLLEIAPTHLEKVINKCQWPTHFYLQQTCRDMKEFIQENNNLCPKLYSTVILTWDEENSCCRFRYCYKRARKGNLEDLYGVRISEIQPAIDQFPYKVDHLPKIWNILEKNRITCERLTLSELDHLNLSAVQCVPLIEAVKPEEVTIDSVCSKRYEAVLQAATVKKVQVYLTLKEVITAAAQLIPKFSIVTIRARNRHGIWMSTCLPALLDIIFSGPFPTLRLVYIDMEYKLGIPKKEIERTLASYNLRWVHKREDFLYFYVELPSHFARASCRISVDQYNSVTLHYRSWGKNE